MSEALYNRIVNMIARGRLFQTDDASGMQFQNVSLLRDETKARVERFQQYGFSSVPPNGSEVVVIFPGGGRDHGIIISVEDRGARIRGQAEGEVALYSDEGDYLVLKRGNQVELSTDHLIIRAEADVVIEAPRIILRCPEVTIEGNLNVTGTIEGNFRLTGDLEVGGTVRAAGIVAG